MLVKLMRPETSYYQFLHHRFFFRNSWRQSGLSQTLPLGPFRFASTLGPSLERMTEEVPELKMNAWYLDGGFLAGDLALAS